MIRVLLLAAALAAGPDPAAVVGPPLGAPRSGAVLHEETNRVSALIRCPVCQGLSVADSPSESALAMRAEVEGLLAQGYDEEQVLTWFEASYGEFIRLEPKLEGFNIAVWLAPVAFVALGALAVVSTMRHRSVSPPPPEEPALDEWRQKVREELER